MRLPKAGLARQQRDAKRAPLYPAQKFQAEPFVHLGEIHLRIIRHRQWLTSVFIFFWKRYSWSMAFVLMGYFLARKLRAGESWGEIDARESYFYIGFTKSSIGLWESLRIPSLPQG
jgi:hypothetical protein